MPIGWAIAGGAVVGALGSIIGGGEQASGAQAAANTQQNMFNTTSGFEQPYRQAGQGAIGGLNSLLGTAPGGFGGLPNGYLTQTFNPTQSQLQNYPGYQFQLSQGDLALQSANSPGVGALSGPALKSLMGYNQGLAGTNYGTYFNQFQTQQNNIFSRLSSIAGLGQSAASNTANTGAQLGTGIAQAQAAGASAIGGGIVGASNAIGGGIPLSLLLANQAPNASQYYPDTGPGTTPG
jgi:hypothetical protein